MISKVTALLKDEDSGHNMDHVMRVLSLAQRFAKEEKADEKIVSLIALLHDVDDYKIFGLENAKNLPHARKILEECHVPQNEQEIIRTGSCFGMGFSKRTGERRGLSE